MERLAGRVILLWGWRRALAALCAGAFAALAQPPVDFFAACFVSFPVLVWLIDGAASQPGERLARRMLRPFAIGWWFGFGYFLAGLWWTGAALLVEAELFAWALPLAVLGLPALLALFYGLAVVLARLLWSDGAGRIAALAAGFAVAEWLRGFVLTGFPWNAIGQAAMPVPLMMQSASAVSMPGINALAVFVFAAPALLVSARGRVPAFAVAALAVALHLGYGAWRLNGADAAPETLLEVRIVQPSISQAEKWDAAVRERIFATLLELSARPPRGGAAAPDLIVWPETAIPFVLSDRPEALVALAELVGEGQTLFAGSVRVEGERADARYYNAIVAIGDDGEIVDAADKIWLVPFGEFMPLADLLSRIGVEKLVRSVSAFTAGSHRPLLATPAGPTALPFICYEIIFPGMAGYGDTEADFILNVTNDAWFGNTPGPYQHFRQAQIRAVEAGRPLVRAGNNGISAVVDAYGRIVDAFALDAVGALDVAVPRQRLTAPGRPDLAGIGILAVLVLWAGVGFHAAGRRGLTGIY
ncbi:MAG: apolipoprotein N-acyltransferase [Aquamicrobium sp.]|uniref:apolipoprotein N-acyltransferase n=1 Tax=Aquamicrobium sp. TaxID=1872579 RepID=UPI00349E6AAB|nr:apolipoprotein N-acyltransferase [Aquamicrobium sp.]